MSPSRTPQKIVIVGAGGHARVVVSILQNIGGYKVVGILDREKPDSSERILGAPVIGGWDNLAALRKKGVACAALALGDNAQRRDMFLKLSELKFKMPALIHRHAFVEKSADVGAGSVVCMGALVGAAAKIGNAVILNSGCSIDHETQVGDYAHVAPRTAVAGRVTIGEGAFVGIGTSVRDRMSIGAWSTVGAGSVVVSPIPEKTTAYGSPARVKGDL